MSPKKESAKKISELASDARPDIGSKPMIVGHSSGVDPMVRKGKPTSKKPEEKPAEPKSESKKTEKVKLEPVTDEIKKTSEKIIEPPSSATADKIKEAPPEEATGLKEEEKKTEEPADAPDAPTADDDKEPEKKKKLDPAAIAMEREEDLRKLIDSKKYRVTIHEQSARSMKSMMLVVVGLLLAAVVGLYVLIDTNTIDIGVEPPFRIFGSEEQTEAATETQSTPQPTTPTPQQLANDGASDDAAQGDSSASIETLVLANDLTLSFDSNVWSSPDYGLNPSLGTRNSLEITGADPAIAIGIDSLFEPPAINERITNLKLCTESLECLPIVLPYTATKVATRNGIDLYSYHIGLDAQIDDQPAYFLQTGISTVSQEDFNVETFDGTITFADNAWLEIYAIILKNDPGSDDNWTTAEELTEVVNSDNFQKLSDVYSTLSSQ